MKLFRGWIPSRSPPLPLPVIATLLLQPVGKGPAHSINQGHQEV